MNSDEILNCLTEQGGYFEEAKYKGMSLFAVADPISELNNDSFYLLSSIDSTGNARPKKNNALIFCISAVERLEIAAKAVNDEFNDNGAVTLTYPYFSGGFSKFEKRKNATGKLQYCGVATSFSAKEALDRFLNYLTSGQTLDNPFDGYYLNFRKLVDIETLLNDANAFYLLLNKVGYHFQKCFTSNNAAGQQGLIDKHTFDKMYQSLRSVFPTNEIFSSSVDKRKPAERQLSEALNRLATLINVARFNVPEKSRLKLGEIRDEYDVKRKQYCMLRETIDSIGMYILAQVQLAELSCCTQKLRSLYDVPHGVFSIQQLAFFLGVKDDSLGPFLRREQPDGMTVRSKMITHHDFGNRKKFLTRESFSFLLSKKVSM